jgi:hypothetical protein
MKKLLLMISALSAGLVSVAKADVSVSGSYGLGLASGQGSYSTVMSGGAIAFGLSADLGNGVTVSTGGTISRDSNDADTSTASTGFTNLTIATGGSSVVIGADVDIAGDGVGEVGFVASAQVDNGGYTQTGIVTGVSDTEGYGFTASTSVGSASLTFGYLLDKAPEGINNAESASGDYGSGVTLAMPMGDMSLTLGYANVTGTADETTAGVAVSYGLGGGTLKVGYESTDEATDSSTVAASFSGSLDADTTYAIGYTDGEQGSLASTATEVAIVRSLGGGVSVFAEIQSLDGSGTSGTNMAVGTTVAF